MVKQGVKILVIDDDPMALALIAHLIGDMAQVDTAQGGVKGLAAAERTLPDMILCDVKMPDIDGLMVCRHLQANVLTRNIPVVCISASIDEEEEIAALRAGAVDFIKKPISPLLARARIKTQIELCQKSDMLLDMARRDPLTGIFNRRYFDERMADEWARHRRSKEPLAMAMIDLDKFKDFNDRYGHVRGDQALMSAADRLRNAARRPGELTARYGGEEFVMLLPRTGPGEAEAFGQWVCEDFQAMACPHEGVEGGILSISAGIAVAIPADSMQPLDLMRRADEALYQAKGSGRNRHALHGA